MTWQSASEVNPRWQELSHHQIPNLKHKTLIPNRSLHPHALMFEFVAEIAIPTSICCRAWNPYPKPAKTKQPRPHTNSRWAWRGGKKLRHLRIIRRTRVIWRAAQWLLNLAPTTTKGTQVQEYEVRIARMTIKATSDSAIAGCLLHVGPLRWIWTLGEGFYKPILWPSKFWCCGSCSCLTI